MSFLNKLFGILAAIGGAFAAVFYVLFKQKKDENEQLKKDNENQKEELETRQKITDALSESQKAGIEEQKKNEELKADLHSGNSAKSFNAVTKLLQDN